jgi:hypothetical protein
VRGVLDVHLEVREVGRSASHVFDLCPQLRPLLDQEVDGHEEVARFGRQARSGYVAPCIDEVHRRTALGGHG